MGKKADGGEIYMIDHDPNSHNGGFLLISLSIIYHFSFIISIIIISLLLLLLPW